MLGFYTRRLFILTKRAGAYIIMHVKIRINRPRFIKMRCANQKGGYLAIYDLTVKI